MTLEDQVKMYLEYVANTITVSSYEEYEILLKHFTRFVKGRRVTKDVVRAWYNHVLSESNSTARKMQILWAAKRMYKWLVASEIVPMNPIVNLPKLIVPRPERPVITEDEHKKILVQADKHGDDDVWPYAVRCAWDTGLRLSDVSLLKWNSVIWHERGIRTIPLKTIRFNKVVEIPVPETFLDFLRAWHLKQGLPSDGYVAPAMASKYHGNNVLLVHAFTYLAVKAGVPKTFHSYRHGWITRMIAKGISAEIISTCTGQTVEQVMQYVHLTMADKHAAFGLNKPPIHEKIAI